MDMASIMQNEIGNIIDYAAKEKEEQQIKLIILKQLNKWKKDNTDLNSLQLIENAKKLLPKSERFVAAEDLKDLGISIMQIESKIKMCESTIKMWQEVLVTEI